MDNRRVSVAAAARGVASAAMFWVSIGASAKTVQEAQSWINLTTMGSIRGNLVYFAEIQGRAGVEPRRFRQLLLRPAVGWRLSRRVTAYLGYARVETGSSDASSTHEDRIFQQLNAPLLDVGKIAITSRTRLEERWRNDGSEMGWRLRQMIRAAVPVATVANNKPMRVLAWSETFFGLNDTDWAAKSGFDQQRSFVGLEISVHHKSTVELGYLNQIVARPDNSDRMNHIMSMTLFIRQ